ncbi:hypothetical protein CQW23_33033 [Capsicum baccatum]|uniref:Conserved oligomeric Golgi complex subunit 7 n=1 Tax=Capsicum baccatum TaxID=33114 RepID=A0A2G2V304_CAPBA|nr:hypothetical protein CQW23_33033 [Capsicum baccatum]
MFGTQAINSDSDNESNYGELENSEYEDDILFDQNVDPSVETFSINIGGNARINDDSEKFISKELQKKMQNEDDDLDCVVSSDMESLNGDSDAKHNPKTDEANLKLELGQIFQNKKKFKEADTTHEIKRGRMVEWIKDDSVRARGALLDSTMNAVTSFRSHSFHKLSISTFFTRKTLKRLETIAMMERAVLSGEIAGLDLREAAITSEGVQGVDLSETMRRMEESIPQVILLLEAVVKRCINFTSSSEVDELILMLNDAMLQYISILIDQNKPDVVKGDGTGQLSVAREVALEVSALRLVNIPEKARKLLNLLEDSKDSRFQDFKGKQVFDELDDDSVVSWTSIIVGLSVASSHQGDSGLMEVPVMAFHGAFHDKTKETGEAVSLSLELH